MTRKLCSIVTVLLMVMVTGLNPSESACREGEICTAISQCPSFLTLQRAQSSLTPNTAAYDDLASLLRSRVCNSLLLRVCCESPSVTPEISGGRFAARKLQIRGRRGSVGYCGASLISASFLATARHCFYEERLEFNFDRYVCSAFQGNQQQQQLLAHLWSLTDCTKDPTHCSPLCTQVSTISK